MTPVNDKTTPRWRNAPLAAAIMFLALPSSPASGQEAIGPDADRILRAMTDHLKSLTHFKVAYDADQEIVDKTGLKLQYSASGSITGLRGAGLHMTRRGPFAETELTIDNKDISIHGKGLNVYLQIENPGASIDEAVEEVRISTGLDLPGADLLSPNAYEFMTEGATSGMVVGTAYVGNVECDHLAFRTDEVDWQIWISTGEKPLPMKYVITTKWVTGAPQYSLRLSEWSMEPVDAALFSFTPPADARKLDAAYSDQIGELVLEMAQ